jgi:hypothetical protein
MFKAMTLNFEMDKLDQVLSHFVGSSLNATCIVILAEKEKKDTTQFKNNLSTCLENTDYFEKLSDMCAILKDPNDYSKIVESDFFFPREAKDGFKLCRRVSNTSIVNDRSMDYYILYREDPSDEADCLFYFSYLQKQYNQFQQADILTILQTMSEDHGCLDY